MTFLMNLNDDIPEDYQNIYVIEKANITDKKYLKVFNELRNINEEYKIKKSVNIKFNSKSFTYLPINSERINIQENISLYYSPSFLNLKSFFQLSRVFTIIFDIKIPDNQNCMLYFTYKSSNNKFYLLLRNEKGRVIFNRNYKYSLRLSCIKDLKSIFLTKKELELFSVEKFTELKGEWFEYLETLKY